MDNINITVIHNVITISATNNDEFENAVCIAVSLTFKNYELLSIDPATFRVIFKKPCVTHTTEQVLQDCKHAHLLVNTVD